MGGQRGQASDRIYCPKDLYDKSMSMNLNVSYVGRSKCHTSLPSLPAFSPSAKLALDS